MIYQQAAPTSCFRHEQGTLYASLFSIIDRTVQVCPAGQTALDTKKITQQKYNKFDTRTRKLSIHHRCLPSLSQGRIGALDTRLPT